MKEMVYDIPQSFVSGVFYRDLQLIAKESSSNSVDLLYEILPKGSQVQIFSVVKMEVDISDNAFEKIKTRLNRNDIRNPKIGTIICSKEKGNIEVSFIIGKEGPEVPLQKIDSELLKKKVETPLMIEKGLGFNDLPYRTIKLETEKLREKPKPVER